MQSNAVRKIGREDHPVKDWCQNRPFQLWQPGSDGGSFIRGRNYSDHKRAHVGALIEARWAAIGAVIEVLDVRFGRLLGQYVRKVNRVDFIEAAHHVRAVK